MLQQLALNAISMGALFALLASGFSLSSRDLGFYDFSYALQFTLGGYLSLVVWKASGSLVLSILLSATLVACFGATVQRAVFHPLAKRGFGPLALLLVSLSLYGVGQNVVALVWGEARQPLRVAALEGVIAIGQARASEAQALGFVAGAFSLALLAALLGNTRLGMGLTAIGDSPRLALLCALPVARYRVYSQAIASGIAALAGTMFALDSGVEPRMGFAAVVVATTASIASRTRGPLAAAVAAFSLAGLYQGVAVLLGPEWQGAVASLVLATTLSLRRGAERP